MKVVNPQSERAGTCPLPTTYGAGLGWEKEAATHFREATVDSYPATLLEFPPNAAASSAFARLQEVHTWSGITKRFWLNKPRPVRGLVFQGGSHRFTL